MNSWNAMGLVAIFNSIVIFQNIWILGKSNEEAKASRLEARKPHLPKISLRTDILNNEAKIIISNSGGVLKIKSIKIDDTDISSIGFISTKSELKNLCNPLGGVHQIDGHFLGSGQLLELLKCKRTWWFQDEWKKEVKKTIDGSKITITYEDIYGEIQIYNN